ncbi:MAG: hypothetical protein ACK5Y2_10225 [Bdellovibrionales bacterium]
MAGTLFVSPRDFFKEAVQDAFSRRSLKVPPYGQDYLVQVLEHYVVAEHLHDAESTNELGERRPSTLAELLLTAVHAEHATKVEMLKKIGDRTLYVCGFFGDSFQRKIVDVDYCVEMGGTAYRLLAESTRRDTLSQVYNLYSKRFHDFVEALNYISEKANLQSTDNVLRIYDRYLRTGSELAREKLKDLGIVPISKNDQKKVSQF